MQPVIENYLKYGYEVSEEGGEFTVLFEETPQGLVITVRGGCAPIGEKEFRELTEKLAAWLLACKGLSAADVRAESHAAYKERQYDLLADAVRTAVDIAAVYRAMDACAAK